MPQQIWYRSRFMFRKLELQKYCRFCYMLSVFRVLSLICWNAYLVVYLINYLLNPRSMVLPCTQYLLDTLQIHHDKADPEEKWRNGALSCDNMYISTPQAMELQWVLYCRWRVNSLQSAILLERIMFFKIPSKWVCSCNLMFMSANQLQH